MPDGGNLGTYVEDHENMPLVVVEVEAWITEPRKAAARIANRFYFIFALPNKENCRIVLPGDLEEARRMASRISITEEHATMN